MSLETAISLSDQLTVEPFFADTGFISCHEQDSLALRVERKSYSPLPISRTKAQFFHIRVARVVQGVGVGPLQLRPELLEKARQCQNFRPHVFVQFVELRFKLIANLNNPSHFSYCMIWSTYDVNSIIETTDRTKLSFSAAEKTR